MVVFNFEDFFFKYWRRRPTRFNSPSKYPGVSTSVENLVSAEYVGVHGSSSDSHKGRGVKENLVGQWSKYSFCGLLHCRKKWKMLPLIKFLFCEGKVSSNKA